jgi:acetate kinase
MFVPAGVGEGHLMGALPREWNRSVGVSLSEGANRATTDADVSAPGAGVRTVVVTAQEDLEVAREVTRVLG